MKQSEIKKMMNANTIKNETMKGICSNIECLDFETRREGSSCPRCGTRIVIMDSSEVLRIASEKVRRQKKSDDMIEEAIRIAYV
jgi:transcription initiation factor IIE alpha subunit